MRITATQLRRIIKKEVFESSLHEGSGGSQIGGESFDLFIGEIEQTWKDMYEEGDVAEWNDRCEEEALTLSEEILDLITSHEKKIVGD